MSPDDDEAPDPAPRHRAGDDGRPDQHDAAGERDAPVDLDHLERLEQSEQAGGASRAPATGRNSDGRRGAGASAGAAGGVGGGSPPRRSRPHVPSRVPPDQCAAGDRGREPDAARAGPERRLREREDRAECQERDPGQQPGIVLMLSQGLDGDRVVRALARHHEHGREVEQDPRPADERERREGDAVDERVHVEVAAEAATDPAEPAAVLRPHGDRRGCGRSIGVSVISVMRASWMIADSIGHPTAAPSGDSG